MFALIETNGANHIAIYIPHQGAEKTIPALVGMLENNAIFIDKTYARLQTCVPKMSIVLGDQLTLTNNDTDMAIIVPNSADVLDDSFTCDSPDVRISIRKAIEKKDNEIKRLTTNLELARQQVQDLQEQIDASATTDHE